MSGEHETYDVSDEEIAYLASVGVQFDPAVHECILDEYACMFCIRMIEGHGFVAWLPLSEVDEDGE